MANDEAQSEKTANDANDARVDAALAARLAVIAKLKALGLTDAEIAIIASR